MQSGNERNSVIVLQLVVKLVFQLPISVIDQHDNAGANSICLRKHLFLFAHVLDAKFCDQVAHCVWTWTSAISWC